MTVFIAPRADMFHPDFRGYSFLAADLRGAHMAASNLEGCDFRGAHLTRAGLSSSNLRNCDFERANLEGADLSRADLTNTNLLFANLGNKRERAKLDGVKGLTDCNLGVLETRMDEIMEHVRIPNFHESRTLEGRTLRPGEDRMRYKDAPPDYPYWPSKYKPEEQSISDTQNSFEPPISREDAIALLRGHAAERFLGDFPKMKNTEASPERALALAAYGAAQDLVERLSQKHSLVRPNLGNS